MRIIELVQKNRHIKLAGNEKLRIERELTESPRTARSWCATCCARSAAPKLLEASVAYRAVHRPSIAPGLVVRGFDAAAAPRRLQADRVRHGLDADHIECVDEIADAAGKKAEVAAITEAAMRGEITDFKESLRRRVALLQGRARGGAAARLRRAPALQPGRRALVAACKAAGLKMLLVSGGFTFFTDRVRDRLGIDFARSNVLEIADGVLTGRMVDQPWGDICDGAEKRRCCSRPAPRSASRRRRRSPWATAPTTCR